VQHRGQTELRPKPLLIFAQGQEGVAPGREEDVEEEFSIAKSEAGNQVIRYGEDDVEVVGR
jgi:hypothetical protein